MISNEELAIVVKEWLKYTKVPIFEAAYDIGRDKRGRKKFTADMNNENFQLFYKRWRDINEVCRNIISDIENT